MNPILTTILASLFVLSNAELASAAKQSEPLVRVAASDCHAVGAAKAKKEGGKLAKATPKTENGQPVCVVVVLVPGKDGGRPRRAEYVIPQ